MLNVRNGLISGVCAKVDDEKWEPRQIIHNSVLCQACTALHEMLPLRSKMSGQ